jgi:uncharacterized membrane protein YfcA
MLPYLVLIISAFLAGIANSVAGGGSFFTFPALVYAGVPSIIANASSTVVLMPAAFASAWAYRQDLRSWERVSLKAMLIVSIIGGSAGAILLLYTPPATFEVIVPWLLLLSTLSFAFGPQISPLIKGVISPAPAVLLATQFIIAIYGGYFGGAVGLIMLALWSLLGFNDIRSMMSKRLLLGGSMNAAAVLCFIVAGKVAWLQTAVMLMAGVTGGYCGAYYARRMNPARVRLIVIVVGIAITLVFFLRTY